MAAIVFHVMLLVQLAFVEFPHHVYMAVYYACESRGPPPRHLRRNRLAQRDSIPHVLGVSNSFDSISALFMDGLYAVGPVDSVALDFRCE